MELELKLELLSTELELLELELMELLEPVPLLELIPLLELVPLQEKGSIHLKMNKTEGFLYFGIQISPFSACSADFLPKIIHLPRN